MDQSEAKCMRHRRKKFGSKEERRELTYEVSIEAADRGEHFCTGTVSRGLERTAKDG